MKNVNKKTGVIVLIIVLILAVAGITYYFTNEDKQTTLTVSEKQWIESNKNKVIDLSIPSDVPVLNSNGTGIVFDFLSSLEKDTKLDFNKLSYDISDKPTSDYAITVTDKKSDKDILIYQDNYVLVTRTKTKYSDVRTLKNMIVGVLDDDVSAINKYLLGSTDLTYKTYKDVNTMIDDIKNNTIDAMTVPRLAYLNDVIGNKDLNIAYNITEYTEDYVLKLGNTDKLNKILNKYYAKWSKENLEKSFTKHLISNYFDVKKVNEKEEVKFRSKRYDYGFVLNSPFDMTTKDGLRGINYNFLSNFAKASNIEINYKKYSSIDSMVKDFETNKLDVIFDNQSKEKFNMDVYKTTSVYDERVSIITNQKTDLVVNSVNSLTDKTVKTVKDSKIDKYLKDHGVKTETYDNTTSLIKHLNDNDLAAIDYYTYDNYVRTDLKKFKNLFTFNLESDYTFTGRDISANKTFNELLNFYLSFENSNKMINTSYKELLNYSTSNRLLQILLGVFGAILLVLIGILTGKFFKRRKTHNAKLSKTDKLRYIDTLTSLKNRNYLNDNSVKWDESEVYPQTIIIIDLNNIAYINDNFGHAEGDKVIVEGAGILIGNQLPNSEIIRTNGNEFLIFMVGHEEKDVVTYIRKLHKEFKTVSHGFGAAIGYSMITDEIKTIDDAVNEATLDMRNNKEEDK